MASVPSTSQWDQKPEEYFAQFELDRFEYDDQLAGKFICKMMSTLLFYAFAILCGVIWWTVWVLP